MAEKVESASERARDKIIMRRQRQLKRVKALNRLDPDELRKEWTEESQLVLSDQAFSDYWRIYHAFVTRHVREHWDQQLSKAEIDRLINGTEALLDYFRHPRPEPLPYAMRSAIALAVARETNGMRRFSWDSLDTTRFTESLALMLMGFKAMKNNSGVFPKKNAPRDHFLGQVHLWAARHHIEGRSKAYPTKLTRFIGASIVRVPDIAALAPETIGGNLRKEGVRLAQARLLAQAQALPNPKPAPKSRVDAKSTPYMALWLRETRSLKPSLRAPSRPVLVYRPRHQLLARAWSS